VSAGQFGFAIFAMVAATVAFVGDLPDPRMTPGAT
jgi:hypothetical protein